MRSALRSCSLFVALVLVGAFLMGIGWTGLPKPTVVENRIPAQWPAATGLVRDFGAWRQAVDAWMADHFPARHHLVGGLNYLRYRLGYSGTARVIVGSEGWLFYDDGSHLSQVRPADIAEADIQAWVGELKARTELLGASGIPYLVLAAPVKESLYRERVPGYLSAPGPSTAQTLAGRARALGLNSYLDLHPTLQAAKAAGRPIYSAYDTHWTGEGAYLGYAAVVQALVGRGVPVQAQPRTAFRAPVPGSLPVPQDLALMLGVASFVDQDYPMLVAADAPAPRITWLTPARDWTADRVIDTGAAGPVLLLTGDSFTNAWLPMLETSFSRIVFSHHQNGFFRPDLIERYRPDAVVLEVIESGLRHAMPPLAGTVSVVSNGRS